MIQNALTNVIVKCYCFINNRLHVRIWTLFEVSYGKTTYAPVNFLHNTANSPSHFSDEMNCQTFVYYKFSGDINYNKYCILHGKRHSSTSMPFNFDPSRDHVIRFHFIAVKCYVKVFCFTERWCNDLSQSCGLNSLPCTITECLMSFEPLHMIFAPCMHFM